MPDVLRILGIDPSTVATGWCVLAVDGSHEGVAARGVCFADVWTPMLDCGMDCISDDGYHPNELGYELIKREVEKCF